MMTTWVTAWSLMAGRVFIDDKWFTIDDFIPDTNVTRWEVAIAKLNLAVGYTTGDEATSVTGNVMLTNMGEHGVSIVWESSATNVISTNGVVTKTDDTVTNVTLTATLSKGGFSQQKEFTLTVLGANFFAVNEAKNALMIGYASGDNASNVTTNVFLTNMGSNGVSIAWESSATHVISTNGVVTRSEFTSNVTLTATLSKGEVSEEKEFVLTVIPLDFGAVQEAIVALRIGYANGDSASRITTNVTLPTSGIYGVSIAWDWTPRLSFW